MTDRPNILFLMCDQLRGDVFAPDHICRTPNLDRLIARGVRFPRAYTPNPVCSPARASLMTGLLPHNHGVMWVTHTIDPDHGELRPDRTHWAQRLQSSGYNTGYFGKWHVNKDNDGSAFGWGEFHERATPEFQDKLASRDEVHASLNPVAKVENPGYPDNIVYGVTDIQPEQRPLGVITDMASAFLGDALQGDDPWCCFVSTPEPHDPYIVSRQVYETYDLNDIPLPESLDDDLAGRPNLYKRSRQNFAHFGEQQHREAAACYFALVTEIDAQFGRLLDQVEAAGQLDNTIVVLTSDHGDYLGAHGLYYKNIGAYEEAYNIPLVLTGPGIARGVETSARVGSHDLCPTLVELTGGEPIDNLDTRSFAAVLNDPAAHEGDFTRGYAEYEGGRVLITQRVVYDGDWKYVYNGFDFDELYNLADDPHELTNLAGDPAYRNQLDAMVRLFWGYIVTSGDTRIQRTAYGPLRLHAFGPEV